MASRISLQQKLEAFLGNRNVYFQPPESKKLSYPCIIYELSNGNTIHADDMPYLFKRRYTVTLITKDPDSDLVDKMAYYLPYTSFDRAFPFENLNHYVYNLFY